MTRDQVDKISKLSKKERYKVLKYLKEKNLSSFHINDLDKMLR